MHEYLEERERVQVKVLVDEMRQDMAPPVPQTSQASGGAAAQATETQAVGQVLSKELEPLEPGGGLVIDLERVLAAQPGAPYGIVRHNGDMLHFPRRPQEVTATGKFQNAKSCPYGPSRSCDDYLQMMEGPQENVENSRTYAGIPKGSIGICIGNESEWLGSSAGVSDSRDTVSLHDVERMRPLPMWTETTAIVDNIAIAVAAMNGL